VVKFPFPELGFSWHLERHMVQPARTHKRPVQVTLHNKRFVSMIVFNDLWRALCAELSKSVWNDLVGYDFWYPMGVMSALLACWPSNLEWEQVDCQTGVA
jgi:hypothetical protein